MLPEPPVPDRRRARRTPRYRRDIAEISPLTSRPSSLRPRGRRAYGTRRTHYARRCAACRCSASRRAHIASRPHLAHILPISCPYLAHTSPLLPCYYSPHLATSARRLPRAAAPGVRVPARPVRVRREESSDRMRDRVLSREIKVAAPPRESGAYTAVSLAIFITASQFMAAPALS